MASRSTCPLVLLALVILGRTWSEFQATRFTHMKNAILLGHTVTSTLAASNVTCIRHCLHHQGVCVAVNYCPITLECQLCSETPDMYGTVVETNLVWTLHYHKGPCDDAWVYYGTSCYRVQPISMTRSTGADYCAQLGAHLLEIDDPLENQFVIDYTTSAADSRVWLGLNDIAIEGTFVWPSGAPLNYLNFGPGEGVYAHEDCFFMVIGTGLWADVACDRLEPVMCEQPIL